MSVLGRRVIDVKNRIREDFPHVYDKFTVTIKKNKNLSSKYIFDCRYENRHVFSWHFDSIMLTKSKDFYAYAKANFLRNYCKIVCKLVKRG